MKRIILTAVVAAAMLAPQCAGAATISADLGLDYAHANDGVNAYGGWGDALFAFRHLAVQLGAGDQAASGGGAGNAWAASSDFFWRDRKGSFGLSVGHGALGTGFGGKGVTSYGLFGEWYAAHNFTLRLRGGAYSGAGTGEYGAIAGEYYLTPNYGLKLGYDYTSVSYGSLSSADVGIDFKFYHRTPLTLWTGFTYTSVSGAGSIRSVGIALKYRFGMRGTLVKLDRTGPIFWDGLLSL